MGDWNLMTKIDQIFDDGEHDSKAKPQHKRSIAFVLAIGFLMIVTSTFTYSYLEAAVARLSILDMLGVLKYVIPAAGLVAFDGGALFWSVMWRNNASNGSQDAIARAMFIAGIGGMVLTTLAGFVDKASMPVILLDITPFAVAIILVANVVAYIEYENRAHSTELAREYRSKTAELAKQRQKAQITLDRAESSLQDRISAAEKMLKIGQLQQQLDNLKLQLNTMKGGADLLSTDMEMLNEAKETQRQSLKEGFRGWVDTIKPSNNGQHAFASEVKSVKEPVDRGNGHLPNS